MKYLVPGSLMVVGLLVFTFSGCGSGAQDSTEPAGSSATPAASSEDHSDHDHGDDDGHDHGAMGEKSGMQSSGMDKMEKGLAGLSPEDAASARKQHVCPVSGEMLGTMGAPIKVEVKGKQVWLCCPGCKDKLLADPDKYLAKLK